MECLEDFTSQVPFPARDPDHDLLTLIYDRMLYLLSSCNPLPLIFLYKTLGVHLTGAEVIC